MGKRSHMGCPDEGCVGVRRCSLSTFLKVQQLPRQKKLSAIRFLRRRIWLSCCIRKGVGNVFPSLSCPGGSWGPH